MTKIIFDLITLFSFKMKNQNSFSQIIIYRLNETESITVKHGYNGHGYNEIQL